jgi:hypothetical protein
MSKFFKFLSGDFLHHPKLQKWHPYFLLLILLAGISIVNEKSIIKKNKIIQKKEYEYKMALSQLKDNNNYLPYHQKKMIRERAKKRGFVEGQKNVFKIPAVNN